MYITGVAWVAMVWSLSCINSLNFGYLDIVEKMLLVDDRAKIRLHYYLTTVQSPQNHEAIFHAKVLFARFFAKTTKRFFIPKFRFSHLLVCTNKK